MSEYETQFTKLSKFTTELVTTEQRRVRFVQRLNVKIQKALAAAQITTFTEVLEKAQRVEIARGQVKAFQAQKRSAPSSEPEELKDTVPPSKARRVNLPPYPPWMQGQYEGSSTRAS